jgi:hypothetical protein
MPEPCYYYFYFVTSYHYSTYTKCYSFDPWHYILAYPNQMRTRLCEMTVAKIESNDLILSSLINLIIQARREAYNALSFLYIHFLIDRGYQGSMKRERGEEKEEIIWTIFFAATWYTFEQHLNKLNFSFGKEIEESYQTLKQTENKIFKNCATAFQVIKKPNL